MPIIVVFTQSLMTFALQARSNTNLLTKFGLKTHHNGQKTRLKLTLGGPSTGRSGGLGGEGRSAGGSTSRSGGVGCWCVCWGMGGGFKACTPGKRFKNKFQKKPVYACKNASNIIFRKNLSKSPKFGQLCTRNPY